MIKMSSKKSQDGSINILLLPLVLMALFFIGALAFGYWAYGGRQDYKNNVDKKIVTANEKAVAAEDIKKDAQFAQAEKSPFKTYKGPEAYGAIQLSFPRTWSSYVDEGTVNSQGVNGYFYPNVVPSITAQTSSFALRVQVLNQSYSSVVQSFNSFVTSKKGTIKPYSLPKLPSIVGIRLDGTIETNRQGSMIILPLRDKTLKIWTEAPA